MSLNLKNKIIIGLFILSFSVRFTYVLTLENKWYFYDTIHFDKAARSILNGDGFGSGYYFAKGGTFEGAYSLEPGYPVFLAIIYKVFGTNMVWVRIVQCVLWGLIAVLTFKIGERIHNLLSGLIAGILLSIFPMHIFISGLLYVTTVYTFSLVVLVYYLLKMSESEKLKYAIWIGLLMGIATQLIPVAFVFYPVVFFWLIWNIKSSNFFKKCVLLFLVFMTTLLSLTPWTIRNYLIFHKIVPIRAAVGEELRRVKNNLLESKQVERDRDSDKLKAEMKHANTQKNSEVDKKMDIKDQLKVMFFDNSKEYLKKYIKEFVHYWQIYPDRVRSKTKFLTMTTKLISIFSYGPLLILAFISMFFSKKYFKKSSLLYLFIISNGLGYSFIMTQIRYRIPIEPFIVILSGFGFFSLLKLYFINYLPEKFR